MRQVPATKKTTTYTLVGSGRLAKHLAHYFDLLGISFQTWSRKHNSERELEIMASHSHATLLLISDDAIEQFVSQRPYLKESSTIHCSGSLVVDGVPSAHPLMTFTDSLYELPTYMGIPFVTELGQPNLKSLIPELPNTSFAIPAEMKPLYHSFCVMSGNFTSILWARTLSEFEGKLNLPKETLFPYMQKIMANIMDSSDQALTGPISRGDSDTIQKNLDALSNHPMQQVYTSFLNLEGKEPSK